jgi:hypothetical protein
MHAILRAALGSLVIFGAAIARPNARPAPVAAPACFPSLAELTTDCGADTSAETEPFKTYTLELPRKPDADEAIRVIVTVRDLAPGHAIVVRTKSREIVGTITPTGLRPGQKGGIYPLPVDPKAMEGNRVILRIEVVTPDPDSKVRAPTKTEVESVALKLIDADGP